MKITRKTYREIEEKAQEAARWAVLRDKAIAVNYPYRPTLLECRAISEYAKSFASGAVWASDFDAERREAGHERSSSGGELQGLRGNS